MQALGALDYFEAHGLACLERLVTVHLDCRKMRKKVDRVSVFIDAFLGLRINEAEAFGVVEPLDLALHTHIPLLQTTPSLEYHPVDPGQILQIGFDGTDLFYPLWALLVVTLICR